MAFPLKRNSATDKREDLFLCKIKVIPSQKVEREKKMIMDVVPQAPPTKKQKMGDDPLPETVLTSAFDQDCGASLLSTTVSLADSSVSEESATQTQKRSVSCDNLVDKHHEISSSSSSCKEVSWAEPPSLDVSKYLRTIATSGSLEEAIEAMKVLYNGLASGSDAATSASTARQITSDLWFSSIVGCLARFQTSEEFCLLVITFLATLLFHEPKETAKVLVDLRAMDTVLKTAMMHPGSELIAVNTVGLISNLSCEEGPGIRASVAQSQHISFVAENMKWKPQNESVLSAGCIYFKNVVDADLASKALLEENDVLMSLSVAMKTFRSSNGDMYNCAKDIMRYVVCPC